MLAADQGVWNRVANGVHTPRSEQDVAIQYALDELHERMVDPRLQLRVALRPGEALLVDNWKVAHAREAYAAGRHRVAVAHFPHAHLQWWLDPPRDAGGPKEEL